MKFILLSVICLLGVVSAKPALTKQKRDILPGDPRYGTDYHHNHHHAHQHQESNEVEVSRALGGYVGSYAVPEISTYQNNVNFQPSKKSYGPPNFTPGKPIDRSYLEPLPQFTQSVKKPVQHQQLQASLFTPDSTIANFKTAENVETVSNAYLAPVIKAAQTPVSSYQPVVQQEQHQVEQVNSELVAPVVQKTVQQTVQKPVDSYGAPIPAYGVPAVENEEQHEVADVKSQATASSETSSDVQVSPSVTVPQEVETVQDTQPQQQLVHQESPAESHFDADSHADTQVQATVKAVQTPDHVSHVHHTAQPAVQQQVQKTVQHEADKTAQQFAQSQNLFQQSSQFPTFYSPDLFTGFEHFGSLGSGFQSYGTPSFDTSVTPQLYNSDLSSLGFGGQHEFNANIFQNGYTGHVHQDTVHQFPQVSNFGQVDHSHFSQVHVPELPSFVASQLPQFPSFQQETLQTVQQPAGSLDVESVNKKQVQVKSQPIGNNGGYVY